MLNIVKSALFLLSFFSFNASADVVGDWSGISVSLDRLEYLQERVEILDEALHGVDAPKAVIEFAHHFEETVSSAAEELPELNIEELRFELNHMREDVFEAYAIMDEIDFLGSEELIRAWNGVISSYVSYERSFDSLLFSI